MIRQIVDRINEGMDFSFKETLLGVVYPVFNKSTFIPGDRDGNAYKDAVPNDKKRSIVYWEDYGTIKIYGSPRYDRFQTTVRLVVWLNFKKINGLTYDDCVKEILSCVPKRIRNEVFINRTGMQAKTPAIFQRYDYRDGKQYVSPPYDVAAFDFNIRYLSTYCKELVKPSISTE